MCKIVEIKVNYGRTVNLGNFESMRVDVEVRAMLTSEDTVPQVVADLERQAKSEVEHIITGKRPEITFKKPSSAKDFF